MGLLITRSRAETRADGRSRMESPADGVGWIRRQPTVSRGSPWASAKAVCVLTVPTESESEGLVEHTSSQSVETTRDRVENSHFTESLSDVDQHDTHDNPCNQDTGGTTGSERFTRTNLVMLAQVKHEGGCVRRVLWISVRAKNKGG